MPGVRRDDSRSSHRVRHSIEAVDDDVAFGFAIGGSVGALLATRVNPDKLRIILMVVITTIGIFKAFRARR
jgi:hypothetical protein